MKFVKILLIALLMMTFAAFPAFAEADYEMVIGHHFPIDLENNEVHPALIRFQELVDLYTDGNVAVEVHGGATLGSEIEVTEEAQAGITVQSSVLSSGAMSSFYEPYQIMTTPFLFPDYLTAWAFFDSDWFADFMYDMREATGLRYLGTFDDGGGFVAFTNDVRLIRTPEDLEGIVIRVEENPAHITIIEAMGASAVPLEWGEVPTALETGIADGQFNAPGLNAAMDFWELVEYSTWSKHIFNTLTWVVNDDWFTDLPDEYQDAILRASREAVAVSRGVSTQLTLRGWEESEERFVDTHDLTPEEQERFREVTRPAFEEWIVEDFGIDEDLLHDLWETVDRINEELSEEYRSKYGY